ncbi:MAG: hypothetical protein QXS41_01315 [Candidatus Woesearchaeota archaeon]
MDIFDINSVIKKTVQEIEEDRFLNLMHLVLSIIGGKKYTQVEEILIEAKMNGYSEKETYQVIEKLTKDKIIEQDKEGRIKKI